MSRLGEFLTSIGLSQYVPLFEANDVDFEALHQLEDAHLKELGISLGHRVKLLNALSKSSASAPADAAPPAPRSSDPEDAVPGAASSGERRQLTVLFCDLVGSTELSANVDPEDMREVMRAYQDACAGMIARYDGYLAKFLGDGVLAYFGYPRAHEDAAERAVRAALGILQTVSRVRTPTGDALQARVGIATGVVVVDHVQAADGASELSAIGETPNLAARLQAQAEPGTVVIGDATHAITRGAFLYTDLGTVTPKGIGHPVRLWRVEGEALATRFEAQRRPGTTVFIGRDQEVGLLFSRWEQALAGEGQAVLLCGEAGIGKSSIAERLRERVAESSPFRIRYQCSPFHANTPLQPVIAQLEFAAGLHADDSNAVRLQKLELLLSRSDRNLLTTVPLLASLLGIPLEEPYAAPQVPPEVLKRKVLDVLVEQLLSLARIKPVYFLVEDVHWIDPTTRELLALCIHRIRDARVLMLVTFRPEFVPTLGHLPHVTALTLNRLSRRQSAELVHHLGGGRALPQEVLEQIVAKTDGIPLFIEELTKTVLESDLLVERDGRFELKGPLPPLAIPATLQDSLMARLDRLSRVREVAQIGSVVGREFSYELVLAASGIPEADLRAALAQLVGAELVFVRGEPPDATYAFRHALIQDAAYTSLLRSRRQQLHARIAAVLEERTPEAVERTPALLAQHYSAAGIQDRARAYWTRAGKQALAGSNYAEAISHLGQALELLRQRPESPERQEEEAQLLIDQAVAVGALKGHGSAESRHSAEEATRVASALGDHPLHFRARWSEWIYRSLSGDLPGASRHSHQLVEMANRLGSAELRLQAFHARWTTAFLRGEVEIARADTEEGLALYDFDQHHTHLASYGAHDPGVCACGTGACALWQAGKPERANVLSRQAIAMGDRLQHPFTQSVARWYAGFLAVMVGDAERAQYLAEATAEVAAPATLPLPLNMAKIIGGWAMTRLGDAGRGADQMERTFRTLVDEKQRGYVTFLGTVVASTKLELGKAEEALALLEEIEQLAGETGQRMFLPDLYRLRAEALRALAPREARIDKEFKAAIRLAREQGAKALELRAATGLAAHWTAKGRERQAQDLLRPIYDSFSEGFDTPDLQNARKLLQAETATL